MRRKLAKAAVLVLLGLLLATVPGLAGCGDDDGGTVTETKEIKYGWLWDMTGRASLAVVQLYDGLTDYLTMIEEEDPIPGVEIKVITYDTRSEPARVIPGYVWLKSQGVTLISGAPHDIESLKSRLEPDQMPVLEVSSMLSNLDSEWIFAEYGTPESQVEAQMHWIMDNWEDYPTKPKIGFVGLSGVPFYEGQRDQALEMTTDYPDKFEWVGAQMSPVTTVSWTQEVNNLMDSDFIFAAMSGSFLANFTMEARARKYDKTLIGPMESFWAFWEQVKAIVSSEDLDGVISSSYYPHWDEDVPFIREIKAEMEKTLTPEEMESAMTGTGRLGGWAVGQILVDAVRRAVDEHGAENVDALALKKALEETDIDAVAEGWGNRWKIEGDINVFARTIRLYRYNGAQDKWLPIVDDWLAPPSLGG